MNMVTRGMGVGLNLFVPARCASNEELKSSFVDSLSRTE